MEIVVSTGIDCSVIIWDISTGDRITTLKGHTKWMLCVCFSPCGLFLASGSQDHTIVLWDCQSWTRIQTFRGHTSAVTSVTFSVTSDTILSSSEDGTVRVWSLVTNMEQLKIETRSIDVFSASLNDANETIAVSCSGHVNIYGARTGELIQSLGSLPKYIT